MEQYNRIINALSIKFTSSKNIDVLNPVNITDFYDVDNTLFLVQAGELYFGKDKNVVYPGEVLFIPYGREASIAYGAKDGPEKTQEYFINEMASSIKSIQHPNGSLHKSRFITLGFKAKVFDAVFFYVFGYPSFYHSKK